MGLCCCKCKNEDIFESEVNSQHRSTISTIVTSAPSPLDSRPIEVVEVRSSENPFEASKFIPPRWFEASAGNGNLAVSINKKETKENAKSSFRKATSQPQPAKSINLPSASRQVKKVKDTKTNVSRQSFEPFTKDKNAAETLNEIGTTKCNISLTNDAIEENAARSIFSTHYKIEPTNNLIKECAIYPGTTATSFREKSPLFAAEKVIRNSEMVREIMQCLYLPKLYFVPIKHTYIVSNLDRESKDYRYVVTSHFRNKKFNDMYEIKQIRRVWNPYLYVQYQIMKDKSDSKTRVLFHGTPLEHLENILLNNFDWRKIKAGKFGWGVSFANNPWYASHYSERHHEGDNDRVMILVRVLVGQTSPGTRLTRIPAFGDTTTNPDGQVLVKFDDATFFPEFIIYFQPCTNNIIDLGSLSINNTLKSSKIVIGETNGTTVVNPIKEDNNDISTLLTSTQLTEELLAVPMTSTNPRSLIRQEEPTSSRRGLKPINSIGPTRSIVPPKKSLGSKRLAGTSKPTYSVGVRRPVWPTAPRSSMRPVGFIRPRVTMFSDKVFAPIRHSPNKPNAF